MSGYGSSSFCLTNVITFLYTEAVALFVMNKSSSSWQFLERDEILKLHHCCLKPSNIYRLTSSDSSALEEFGKGPHRVQGVVLTYHLQIWQFSGICIKYCSQLDTLVTATYSPLAVSHFLLMAKHLKETLTRAVR